MAHLGDHSLLKGGRQSKISLKENGVVSFDPKKKQIFFVGFSQI